MMKKKIAFLLDCIYVSKDVILFADKLVVRTIKWQRHFLFLEVQEFLLQKVGGFALRFCSFFPLLVIVIFVEQKKVALYRWYYTLCR